MYKTKPIYRGATWDALAVEAPLCRDQSGLYKRSTACLPPVDGPACERRSFYRAPIARFAAGFCLDRNHCVKAHQRLGWRHKTSFDNLVKEMVDADLVAARHEQDRKNRHD